VGALYRRQRTPRTIALVRGSVAQAGAPVNFVVTSDAGTATCTADGQPFVSGNTLSLGSHAIVCSATNASTGATGQATATVTVVLSGPPGAPGAPGPQLAGLPAASRPRGLRKIYTAPNHSRADELDLIGHV
jgi:hypothetical protein